MADPKARDMTFVVGGTVTAEHVRDVLKANGVEIDSIVFVSDPWPHVVLWSGAIPEGELRGRLTFESHFSEDTVGLTATVSLDPWKDLDEEDDGMPPDAG